MKDAIEKELYHFADELDKAGLKACGISISDFTEKQEVLYRARFLKERDVWVKLLFERDNRIRAESAEQVRKEDADIAVAWVDNNLNSTGDITREEFASLRAAILGDSVIKENPTTDHVPDAGKTVEEKLEIATQYFEEIVCRRDVHDCYRLANEALREIKK